MTDAMLPRLIGLIALVTVAFGLTRPALLQQRETVSPPPSVIAPMDPATEAMKLNLGSEDRPVVQDALTAVGFDTRGTDGMFAANTRRVLIGPQWKADEKPTNDLTSSPSGKVLAAAEPKLVALENVRSKPSPSSSVQSAADIHQYGPGEEFRDCNDCPLMVVVPAGSFTMGSSDAEQEWAIKQGAKQEWVDREKTQHSAKIGQPFAVGKYEVTRVEFTAFVEARGDVISKGCWDGWDEWKENTSNSWRAPGFGQNDHDPVVCVSWHDAKAYIAWLSERTGHQYRLLSEAEWEFAARAQTTTMRPWGDDQDNTAGCAYANGADLTAKEKFKAWRTMDCRDGQIYTAPVGTYSANAFGLTNMIGNAWEWVEDCWNESYEGAPSDGSAWMMSGDCSRRVLRGGSWFSTPEILRSALRDWGDSEYRDFISGFRVARTLR